MTTSIISEVSESSRGGFFQIDSRSWAHVTKLNMNSAVAYLVLARGTGPDNRTTCWSVHSIETYTGISRGRAIRAIKTLLNDGAVKLIQGGTRPKYELLPWVELNKTHVPESKPMSERQRKIFESIRTGKQPRGSDATLIPSGHPQHALRPAFQIP